MLNDDDLEWATEVDCPAAATAGGGFAMMFGNNGTGGFSLRSMARITVTGCVLAWQA